MIIRNSIVNRRAVDDYLGRVSSCRAKLKQLKQTFSDGSSSSDNTIRSYANLLSETERVLNDLESCTSDPSSESFPRLSRNLEALKGLCRSASPLNLNDLGNVPELEQFFLREMPEQLERLQVSLFGPSHQFIQQIYPPQQANHHSLFSFPSLPFLTTGLETDRLEKVSDAITQTIDLLKEGWETSPLEADQVLPSQFLEAANRWSIKTLMEYSPQAFNRYLDELSRSRFEIKRLLELSSAKLAQRPSSTNGAELLLEISKIQDMQTEHNLTVDALSRIFQLAGTQKDLGDFCLKTNELDKARNLISQIESRTSKVPSQIKQKGENEVPLHSGEIVENLKRRFEEMQPLIDQVKAFLNNLNTTLNPLKPSLLKLIHNYETLTDENSAISRLHHVSDDDIQPLMQRFLNEVETLCPKASFVNVKPLKPNNF